MEKKLTQKDYFNAIIKVLNGEEVDISNDKLAEFCADRIDKLSRKSSSKKPTKVQVENESIKETILTVLEELGNPTSATALATDSRINVSNQKVTSLLKQLKDEGKVIRTEEKGKALFSLVDEE